MYIYWDLISSPSELQRTSQLIESINSNSMDTSKGTERINEDGAVEITVETVDYRTPPGQDKEPQKENVEVTRVIHEDEIPGPGNDVAGKVAEKLQSVKEAISGGKANKSTD